MLVNLHEYGTGLRLCAEHNPGRFALNVYGPAWVDLGAAAEKRFWRGKVSVARRSVDTGFMLRG